MPSPSSRVGSRANQGRVTRAKGGLVLHSLQRQGGHFPTNCCPYSTILSKLKKKKKIYAQLALLFSDQKQGPSPLRDLGPFTHTAGRQQSWDASPAGLRENPCQVQGQACDAMEEQWGGDMEEQCVFRGSIVKSLLA